MKRNLMMFLAALTLLGMQACGPKTQKESETAVSTPVVKAALTPAEKKANREKKKAELMEKRRIQREKQAELSPYFTDAEGNVVYYTVSTSPSFTGGNDAMRDYLHNNLKYPEAAREKGIEGTVFVDFIVTKFGNVRAVEVTDTTDDDVDQTFRNEAIRVVTAMPKWTPGNQNGKNVDVKFSIPVTFEMM